MLNPQTKRTLFRIIPFGLMWMAFGLIYALIEKAIIGDLGYYPSTGNPYNFQSNVILTPLMSLIIGMGVGTVEVMLLNQLFVKKGLAQKVVFKTLIYVGILCLFLGFTAMVNNAVELDAGLLDPRVLANVWVFITSPAFWILGLFVGMVMILVLFFLEVSDNLGQQVLTNFLTGKYHTPKEEERIFIFLDMRSSTTIAERLGHVHYFNMLNEYYADLSPAIVKNGGEIYQYVGDEVIVTWKAALGIKQNNCLNCFFQMKEALRERAPYYQSQYGLVPEFKAGMHMGRVTTGELGVIKKDITFTGDVLNTTARIQDLCNNHGADLIISQDLLNLLDINSQYQLREIGTTALRGRDQQVQLFSLDLAWQNSRSHNAL